LGIRGISVFKFDGGQDPQIWNTLAGHATKPVAIKSAVVTPSPTPSPTPAPSGSRAPIVRAIKIGSVGTDVKILQMILNSDVATRVTASGAGSPGKETERFASLTLAAVKKFQVKHGIASPGKAGYGSVGPLTRAKLNSLLSSI